MEYARNADSEIEPAGLQREPQRGPDARFLAERIRHLRLFEYLRIIALRQFQNRCA